MAAVTAAVIGAAGALGGGAFSYFGSKPKKSKLKKIKRWNPLYNAQLIEAMIGLGVPVPEDMLLAASPLGQTRIGANRFDEVSTLIRQGIDQGLSDADIAKQLAGLDANRRGANFLVNRHGETRGRVGYNNLEALVRDQREFMGSAFANQSEVRRLQEESLAGRRSAQSAIARIQGDFVAPSEEELAERTSEIENILRAQIERDFGEQREQSLYEANAYGINPAGRLGRLDESQALANLGTGPDSLARTLQLVAGRQGVQATALGSLQNSLQPAIANASGLLGMQMNQNASAAQQALGIAQLQSQNNQLLAGGVRSASQQLAATPELYEELQRRRRREIDSQIDSAHGIVGPINDDENDQFGF
jgi:hypothetical protein